MLAASLELDIGPEALSRGCYLANKVSFTRPCRHVHGICAFSIPCALNIVFDAARRKPFSFHLLPSSFFAPSSSFSLQSNLLLSLALSVSPLDHQQPPRAGQKNYFDLISQINLSARGRTLSLLSTSSSGSALSLSLFLSLVILYGRLGMVSARTWPGKKSSLANWAPRERAEGDFWSQKHASYAKSLCNTSPSNGDIFYGPWGKVVPRRRDICEGERRVIRDSGNFSRRF